VEEQVEELLSDMESAEPVSVPAINDAATAHVFEYTVLEDGGGEQISYDTSGIVNALVTEWDAGPQGEVVQCVTPDADTPSPSDDRDMIDVETDEMVATREAVETHGTGEAPVRRMDYQDLFAQLRRVD
jgi:hypothetical protein